jgi:hypothetical protein
VDSKREELVARGCPEQVMRDPISSAELANCQPRVVFWQFAKVTEHEDAIFRLILPGLTFALRLLWEGFTEEA